MQFHKIKKLVIKPTIRCTANCATCAGRLELHKGARDANTISYEQWNKILADCSLLGVEGLEISGGEPTLYKNLIDLVKIGRSYGWRINMNTNGSLITPELARELVSAGLTSVHISLYSATPEIHNSLRRAKKLWEKAVRAISIFSDLEQEFPGFRTQTQTLICRENFHELPEIIALHKNLGSHQIALSYLEGDFTGNFLLQPNEIKLLREKIIPRALNVCHSLAPSIQSEARRIIGSLYSTELLTDDQWSKGIYRPAENNDPICQRPREFALILANGDVHPCNIVEYTHEPVMGNVFNNSIAEIWNNDKWNDFRQHCFDKCQFCPINLYMAVPLIAHSDNSHKPLTAIQKQRKKVYRILRPVIKRIKPAPSPRIMLPIDLMKTQYWPLEQLQELQNERLRFIVRHAYNTVPGYREKFQAAKITPDDIRTTADLPKLPILTRPEIQHHGGRFVDTKSKVGTMYSGGSSGDPLEYSVCQMSELMRDAVHWRGWNWNGFYSGMKYVSLKRSPGFIQSGDCLHLIAELTTDNLRRNVEKLQEYQPSHIKGYVNALYLLAKYIVDNKIELNGIFSATPSSENFYELHRDMMEQAFKCSVYEEYCCNDGGACGWECEKREGLHYAMERAIIEEHDGEMIVTDLWNTAMPFIRYQNGDYVEFLKNTCTCGRTLPLMKVKGRANDILITDKGAVNPSFILCKLLDLGDGDKKTKTNICHAIRYAQFIQKPGKILDVLIVKNPWCTQNDIKTIKRSILSFSDNLKVNFQFVEDINTTMKMKRSCIINEDRELLNSWLASNNKS